MINTTLAEEIGNYLDLYVDSDIRYKIDEEELAYRLKSRGFCSDHCVEYEKALCCQINKRRERQCYDVHCENYEFCNLMRKEGYV